MAKGKASSAQHPMLRIEGPKGRVQIVDLLTGSYVLGRGDPSGQTAVDFEVPEDEYLSRAHARISHDGSGHELENLSANGTLLNGKIIEKPQTLRNKDRIEIGAGTTATYLVASDVERRRLLGEGADKKTTSSEDAADEPAKRSFVQSPVFIGMIVFYGLLALLLLGLTGGKEEEAKDPGTGPYFEAALTGPLPTEEPEEDSAARAKEIWDAAMARHGGALIAEGSHAYRLVEAARKAAGIMGYGSLAQAIDKGETFAVRAKLLLKDLQDRCQALYEKGDAYVKGRHWDRAYEVYKEIVERVPDNRVLLRRFALARMAKLEKLR